jgi:hypothetical protein
MGCPNTQQEIDMIAALKTWFFFCDAKKLAALEMQRAERDLLEAQTNVEYWNAIATFNTERIERLTRYVRWAE